MTHLIIPDLIRDCIKGERKSQKQLYDLYAPKMFAICLRYANNQMDAEDMLQDGFLKLYNNLAKFRGEGSFEGWVRRIFVNTAIEHLRRKNATPPMVDEFPNAVVDRQKTGLDNLYEKDIIKASKTLSKGYRNVFHLFAVEGYSHRDISKHMGISESTSKSQYSRGRLLLKNIICSN